MVKAYFQAHCLPAATIMLFLRSGLCGVRLDHVRHRDSIPVVPVLPQGGQVEARLANYPHLTHYVILLINSIVMIC